MASTDFQNYKYFTHAINANGKLVEIPLRKGKHDAAFIDAITFTIRKTTIDIIKGICVKFAALSRFKQITFNCICPLTFAKPK